MKLVRSSKIVILNKSGFALLLRRSETHPTQAFHADLPGGITEASETIEDGLVREIMEETGLDIERVSMKLLYTFTHNFPGVSVNRLLYGVRVQEESPAITLSYEHGKYEWVKLSELKDLELPYQQGVDYATKHSLWDSI